LRKKHLTARWKNKEIRRNEEMKKREINGKMEKWSAE
jgi:hypothetical protein